jgi:hypothetical protein
MNSTSSFAEDGEESREQQRQRMTPAEKKEWHRAATDIYNIINDCKRQTLSAHSSPSRKVAVKVANHATELAANGSPFKPYTPSKFDSHFCNPIDWRRLLDFLWEEDT